MRMLVMTPWLGRIAAAVIFLAGAPQVYAGIDTWTSQGPAGGHVNALAVDPVAPTIMYAGTRSGVFKTIDGGNAWVASSSGMTNTVINSLAIDPITPTTLYAGSAAAVFRTNDGGATWNAVSEGSGGLTRGQGRGAAGRACCQRKVEMAAFAPSRDVRFC